MIHRKSAGRVSLAERKHLCSITAASSRATPKALVVAGKAASALFAKKPGLELTLVRLAKALKIDIFALRALRASLDPLIGSSIRPVLLCTRDRDQSLGSLPSQTYAFWAHALLQWRGGGTLRVSCSLLTHDSVLIVAYENLAGCCLLG